MDFDQVKRSHFIDNLRRALPLAAHPRPPLIAFLRERGVIGRGAPRLVVLDIFDAGAAGGLMCRFAMAEDGEASSFIAPLAQVALDAQTYPSPDCAPGDSDNHGLAPHEGDVRRFAFPMRRRRAGARRRRAGGRARGQRAERRQTAHRGGERRHGREQAAGQGTEQGTEQGAQPSRAARRRAQCADAGARPERRLCQRPGDQLRLIRRASSCAAFRRG